MAFKHEYAKDGDQLDQNKVYESIDKQKFTRSERHINFGNQLGRDDNLLYRISEGYNLEDNDRTYFDKYKIREMMESISNNSISVIHDN
jgi:tetrahydromethanopterin S-methyltransferase subunit G